MTLQDTLSITYRNASDLDKLKVVYGQILRNIATSPIFNDLINRNYSGSTDGGSVNVKRMKFSTVRAYGTARAAGEGDKLQNNGIDVLIDQDKEIVDEVEKKDLDLYGTGAELLANLVAQKTMSMQIHLEDAYFVALQTAAATFDASAYTGTVNKVLALIRALEAVTGDNVNKIDRSLMVLTLAPEFFDELQSYVDTLPNPRNGGVEAKFFHGVEVRAAVRQDVDAVIQVRGSMAMPVRIDSYSAGRIQLSNAYADELYFSYGIEAVMPEAILKCALSGTISA